MISKPRLTLSAIVVALGTSIGMSGMATAQEQPQSLFERLEPYLSELGTVREDYRVSHYNYTSKSGIRINRKLFVPNGRGGFDRVIEEYYMTGRTREEPDGKGFSHYFEKFPRSWVFNNEIWVERGKPGLNGDEEYVGERIPSKPPGRDS